MIRRQSIIVQDAMPSEDEAACSPSLYQQEKMSKDVDGTRYSDEEDYDEEEEEGSDRDRDEEIEEEEKEEEFVEYWPALSKSGVMERLSMLDSQFNDTLKELHSTKQSRKSARSDFEFPPSPPRKRRAPFTPPKAGRVLVPSTQDADDLERDSLASQNSRRQRKRLIDKWQIVDVVRKSDFTKEEAYARFVERAVNELAKAGSSDDVIPRADDLGLFRRAQVSFYYIYLRSIIGS